MIVYQININLFSHRTKLEETKERQRLRNRPNGVSIAGLALGKKLAPSEEISIVSTYIFIDVTLQRFT